MSEDKNLIDYDAPLTAYDHEHIAILERLRKAEAANKALVEALEYYADPAAYMTWINYPEYKSHIEEDRGAKARKALAAAVSETREGSG